MAAAAEIADTDVAAAVAAPTGAPATAPADGAAPAEDSEAAAAAKAARQLEKKLKKEQQKKEQKEKKEKKAAAAAAASAKKKGQSNEGMDVGKEEDFPRWYNQVITKSELIEFYDISVRWRGGVAWWMRLAHKRESHGCEPPRPSLQSNGTGGWRPVFGVTWWCDTGAG